MVKMHFVSSAKYRVYVIIFLLYTLIFFVYFFPVLTHLGSFVYGIISDNFWWFIWGFWSKNYKLLGFNDIYVNQLYGIGGFKHIFWNSSHPLGWGITSELIRYLPTNVAYNIVMISTFPLAAFFAYMFFYYLTKNKYISFLFGFLFSFSPYHIYSSQRHTELAITWVIPFSVLSFIWAFDKKSAKSLILASLALAFTQLNSVYWGVYISIFIFCYFLAYEVTEIIYRKFTFKAFIPNLKFLIYYFVLFAFFVLPFIFPYVKANYFTSHDTTRGWVYQNTTVVKRGLSDFVRYSIMPYHFFIPPVSNPFLGNFGRSIVSFIKDNWDYFLAKNYFFSEHGGDYLGILNSALFIVSVIFALLNRKKQISKLILSFSLASFFLYLFSMPPFFTISGVSLYAPSYLVYLLFPMLRTLSRMGVIIFLCVLTSNALFLSYVLSKARSNYLKIAVLIFTIITALEFYMPLKYINDTKPPKAYEYIGSKDVSVTVNYKFENGEVYKYNGPAFIVEYPWGYDAASFYQKYYKKGFANPLFYVNPKYKFNAMDFSYEVDSLSGLKKAYNLGVRFVVYHKNDEDTMKRIARGEDPFGFFKQHSRTYKDFGEIVVFELNEPKQN